jgi:phosphoglycolate phosphatase-like HAD superfamily hydrolase
MLHTRSRVAPGTPVGTLALGRRLSRSRPSCPGRTAGKRVGSAIEALPRNLTLGRGVSANAASNGSSNAEEDPEDKKNVWALDFDGVVCDSCGESSLSAWKAATELWPEIFGAPEALEKKDRIVEDMRVVRPVVETGYENIVQIRCLLEGVRPQDMLENWSAMLPECMDEWNLDRQFLVELFGRTRDEWIESDLDGWLAPNRIYPGVPEAMDQLMVEHEVYIVTTKQARFTEMILERMAFIDFPSDRIFSQTISGKPKTEVLQMLQERHPGTRYHFVEDKYSTLKKVEREPSLDAWNLYLVDWGYNVRRERDEAAASDRLNMVDISQFRSVIDAF